jgi:exonuclease SbcC
MIEQVRLRNVKGLSLDQELTGLDLFVGVNGVGKSARLQAMAGSILGYVPGKGKLAGETMGLASGNEMTMGITLDTGFMIDRTFKRTIKRDARAGKETSSTSMDIAISPSRGESTQAQKEARIAAEVGQVSVILDFESFASMTDTEKRKFIAKLSQISSGLTREEIEKRLRADLLTLDLQINDPDQYAAIEQFITEAMGKYPEGYDVQAGLQAMLDWATAQRKTWEDERKKSQAAAQKLNEMKAQLADTDRGLSEKKTELEQIQAERRKIAADIAANEERKRQAESRAARLAELEMRIAELSRPVENAEEVKAFEAEIASATNKMRVPDFTEANRLAAEYERLQGEITGVLEERAKKQAELARYQAEIAKIDEYVRTVREFAGKPKRACVLDPAIGCPREDGFEKYFAAREKQREDLSAKAGEIETAIRDIDAKGGEIKASMVEIRTAIEKARMALEATQADNQTYQIYVRTVEEKLSAARQAGEKRQAQLSATKEEYDRLRLEPIAPYTDVSMLRASDAALAEQEAALSQEIQAKEEAARQLIQTKETMISAKAAVLKADAAKLLVEALGPKGILGLLVKEVKDDLAGEIQENLRLMGREEEFFLRTEDANGKEVFEFGWIGKNGIPVQFEDLSKGQKLLLTAAMVAAFLGRANPPVKILAIDDVDGIHPNALPAVLAGLAKLRGKVDNLLLAGAILPPTAEGWNVVQVEEGGGGQCVLEKTA